MRLLAGLAMLLRLVHGANPSNTSTSALKKNEPKYDPKHKPNSSPNANPPSTRVSPKPTTLPTLKPTPLPTLKPNTLPTLKPTPLPTLQPTSKPTPSPSVKPTVAACHGQCESAATALIGPNPGDATCLTGFVPASIADCYAGGALLNYGNWYSWTAPFDCFATVVNTPSPDFGLMVYSGPCGALSCLNTTNNTIQDDAVVSFRAKTGKTYSILSILYKVVPYKYTLNLDCPAPCHDTCYSAQAITLGTNAVDSSCLQEYVDATAPDCVNTGKPLPYWGNWVSWTNSNSSCVATVTAGGVGAAFQAYEGSCGNLTCSSPKSGTKPYDDPFTFVAYSGKTYNIFMFYTASIFGVNNINLTCV